MIKNERQYKFTNAQKRKLEESLATFKKNIQENIIGADVYRLQLDTFNSLIADLGKQMKEYEALKDGRTKSFKRVPLHGLPKVLIKARISRGYTHKQMAELLDWKEQQVQYYEENEYEHVSFWKLLEVATVLDIEVTCNALLLEHDIIAQEQEEARQQPPQRKKRAA